MKKTCFCGISEHCGYQIETDMEQHDKVIYEQGYNKAIDAFAQVLSYKIKLEIDDCADELEWVNEIAEQLKG